MNFKSSKVFQARQGKGLLLMLIALIITTTEIFAQDYTLELNQRRMGDQLGVEFWLRKDNSSAKSIASFSMAVTYNTAFLQPAASSGYAPQTTDSILTSLEGNSAYEQITSPFHSANGYNAISVQASNDGSNYVYSMQSSLSNPENGEVAGNVVAVGNSGKGTFVGMLVFDIINHATLGAGDNANFALNTLPSIGKFELLGYGDGVTLDTAASLTDGNLSLVAVPTMAIKGIDILNPNGPNEAVNRDKVYSFMNGIAGYPIYFERSGLITPSATKKYGTSNELAYSFSYSTDANNTDWNEFLRVAETRNSATTIGTANLINYRNGEITATSGVNSGYYITQADGSQLPVGAGDGYGGILRVIWDDDPLFAERSERAKLRILQLAETSTTDSIANRANGTISGTSDATFILSRLFFLYFDGTKYVKTKNVIDYHTELTLEAWVNMSEIHAGGDTETGIIALAGENSATEGVAMLYLAEGKYPAFRVKESVGGVGRGQNGGDYIATLVSPTALTAVANQTPIDGNLGQSANWYHIAGVLDKNILSLYVNGELVDKYTNTNATDITPVDNNGGGTGGHYIWIGINPNGAANVNKYFTGGIKEVKMWRDALTQSDIRTQMPGVTTPATMVSGNTDIRYGLRAYYSFKGISTDLANHVKSSGDQSNQEGADQIGWYEGDPNDPRELQVELYPYRPDLAHIRILSPTASDGVKNLSASTFEVRWASYGVGDEASAGSDMLLQYSRDGGTSWAYAIDESGLLLDDIDVEDGSDNWEPYQSTTSVGSYNDLQAVAPGDSNYSKTLMLRLAGTSANNQTAIADTTASFELAPYFVLENTGENSIIEIAGGKGMNLLGGEAMFEAWVSPYRLPTTTEGSFPIITKADTVSGNLHYSVKILASGQLQLDIGTKAGQVLSAVSSSDKVIIPNTVSSDTTWTHLAVYTNLGNGTSAPSVKMYVDGNLQSDLTGSLIDATSVVIDDNNEYPTYLGWYLNESTTTSGTITTTSRINGSFIGALKGIRYWNASPGGSATNGSEPTALTLFMQGVANVQASELLEAARTNLIASFDFDGGSVVADNQVNNSLYSVINGATDSLAARIKVNNGVKFTAAKPFIKLVEPVAGAKIKESDTDVKVRWIGFNYDKDGFQTGDLATTTDSYLEWSSNGGSRYDPTSSDVDGLGTFVEDAFSLPLTSSYKFPGTNPPLTQFAGNLSATYTKSDFPNNVQASFPVSEINDAQLQIKAEATINAPVGYDYLTWSTLQDQSSNFTVTAKSNFTMRVLLEGYQRGRGNAFTGRLGSVWSDGALKLSIYNDQGGRPATSPKLKDTSDADYVSKDPFGANSRLSGGSRFGDVEFVFSELQDSTYFVLIEHRNHLPVLSRYAVPFLLSGDDTGTWGIESGWDFQMWDGDVTDSISASNAASLTMGNSYAAWGALETDENASDYGRTGLHFNIGLTADTADGLAAMVAGDVLRDGQILSSDIAQVYLDAVSTNYRSDVTGDSLVDADDRTIVDRNFGLNASILDVIAWDSLYNDAASQGSIIDIGEHGIYNDLNVDDLVYSRELNQRVNHILANPEKYRSRVENGKSKVRNSLQNGEAFDFDVYATSSYIEGTNYVEVSFYLKNNGRPWAPGHCTFEISYDNNQFNYISLEGAETSLWAKDPNPIVEERNGYRGIYSGPTFATLEPKVNVRTVEINYDNRKVFVPELGKSVKQTGEFVPYEKELVATVRFEARNPESGEDFNYAWSNLKIWDIDGNQITEFGEKHLDGADNPSDPTPAMITYPNGGEVWKAGDMAVVYWTTTGDVSQIDLELTVDGGDSWLKLNASSLELISAKYDWVVEEFDATDCMIRMVDALTRNEIDRSDNMFTIKVPQNFITKPATSDPIYYGGEVATIKWMVDSPKSIRFSFSANGTTGWTEIVPIANSQSAEVQWKVPSGINTDRGVISMFDFETNQFLAQSSPFRVLAGKLAITSPVDGQEINLEIDDNATVRWESDNVARFDLQFSSDAGATWESVENSVNALTYNYNWLVSPVATETGVLRALYLGNENLEYSRSGLFSIKLPGTNVEDIPQDEFYAGLAYPTPFASETNLTFSLPSAERVTAKLFNSAGLEILTLHEDELLSRGSHQLTVSAENLSSGYYFLRISAGGKEFTRDIVVQK